jgi:hypothetical protein
MPLVPLAEDDPAIRQAVDFAAEALRVLTTRRQAPVPPGLGPPEVAGAAALIVIRGVRAVPMIVATARRCADERVRLLDADDDLAEPFAAKRALVLRRPRRDPSPAWA